MKVIVLASASVLAIAAAPAQSQSSPAPQSTVTTASGASSSAAPDATTGLQDIIVTAQRTEQSAQKAPLPISVVRPEDLVRQNVVRAEDLSRIVPALVAANNGGATTSFFLRGVGNFTANSYSDPAIAFNYDGVYLGRPSNTQGIFYDLQRVEVLKGPQGTLYGRNATGGAVNVIPNRPVIGETSAAVQASYGNYNAVQAQGDINLPIGDTGAFRLSSTYNRHDAYLSDGTSNQRVFGLRAQVLADLTPDLTTRIAADYAHDGGTGTGGYLYGTDLYNPATNSYVYGNLGLSPYIGIHDPRSNAAIQTIYVPQVGRTAEALGTYPSINDGFWGVTNETNWKTDAGTLTVQGAYREGKINALSTAAAFRDDVTNERDQQYSFEARFAGKVGPIDYLVGGYYFKENIRATFIINQLDLTSFQNYATGTESKAGFGRLSYHVTPTVTLTAAGRYTNDFKTFNGVSDNYLLFCGNGRGAPANSCPNLPLEPYALSGAQLVSFYQARGVPTSTVPLAILGLVPPSFPTVFQSTLPINATTTTNKFTYRLAADWQVTPSNLLYASYETGFHGGGFSFARGLSSYLPETIEAYTIGSKNRFFDRRVQLNIEGFYWKYKNQQFSQFGYDLGTPPSLVFYTSNVGRSTIKGVDADLDVLVTKTTRINGSVQYLDTRYDSFITYAPNQGLPPNYNCPYTPIMLNGQAQYRLDCSGKPGVNAPKWSFNVNLEQTFTLGDYKLVVQGGTRYRGAYYVAATYQPWTYSPGAFQSDASLTLSPAGDRYFISAFINNIEDKRRIVQDAPGAIGTLGAITTDPRTFGVRVGARFK